MKVAALWSPAADPASVRRPCCACSPRAARRGGGCERRRSRDTVAKAGDAADRLTAIEVNIGDEASVAAGVAAAVEALGGLDVLVNAAGILRSSHTAETTLDQFQQVIQVNLVGTFLMIREAIPALLEGRDAAVVNFSSTSAMFAHPYMAAYAASKGGAVDDSCAGGGVRQAGHPLHRRAARTISSGMTDGSGQSGQSRGPGLPEDADMSLFMKLAPAIGQGFAGPESVAGVVAMLASADGAFITGTEVRIDGGTHF
jgi:NAD(P)-dependent dehydrogenase (short-subunit alcohol dehydrogenase family)